MNAPQVQDEVGALWPTPHLLDDGSTELSVDQADPRILVSNHVLEELAFDTRPRMWPHTPYDEASRLLRIHHREGTLIYRIVGPALPFGLLPRGLAD